MVTQPAQLRLVAEADRCRDELGALLSDAGYAVTTSTSAVRAPGEPSPQIAVVRLPMRSVEIVADLRRDPLLPIVCLSQSRLVSDKIAALQAGADDVLAEPYDAEELLARLQTWVRRGLPSPARWTVGDLVVDATTRTVTRGHEYLPLPRKYLDVLLTLARAEGQAVSKQQLANEVWGRPDVGENLIEVTVSQLRRRLGESSAGLIATVYGGGYRLIE